MDIIPSILFCVFFLPAAVAIFFIAEALKGGDE